MGVLAHWTKATRGPGLACVLGLALVLAPLGCGPRSTGPAPAQPAGPPATMAQSQSPGPPASAASAISSDVAELKVSLIDDKDLQQVLNGLRGKVVLVDFWATWCGACVENFPHTVQLHRQLAPQGLEVVAVSMDEPEDAPQVRKFLAGQEARFLNFQSKLGGSSDEAIMRFQIRDGTLPHLRLYDRRGGLRYTFPSGEGGKLDPQAIERTVRELLEEPAA